MKKLLFAMIVSALSCRAEFPYEVSTLNAPATPSVGYTDFLWKWNNATTPKILANFPVTNGDPIVFRVAKQFGGALFLTVAATPTNSGSRSYWSYTLDPTNIPPQAMEYVGEFMTGVVTTNGTNVVYSPSRLLARGRIQTYWTSMSISNVPNTWTNPAGRWVFVDTGATGVVLNAFVTQSIYNASTRQLTISGTGGGGGAGSGTLYKVESQVSGLGFNNANGPTAILTGTVSSTSGTFTNLLWNGNANTAQAIVLGESNVVLRYTGGTSYVGLASSITGDMTFNGAINANDNIEVANTKHLRFQDGGGTNTVHLEAVKGRLIITGAVDIVSGQAVPATINGSRILTQTNMTNYVRAGDGSVSVTQDVNGVSYIVAVGGGGASAYTNTFHGADTTGSVTTASTWTNDFLMTDGTFDAVAHHLVGKTGTPIVVSTPTNPDGDAGSIELNTGMNVSDYGAPIRLLSGGRLMMDARSSNLDVLPESNGGWLFNVTFPSAGPSGWHYDSFASGSWETELVNWRSMTEHVWSAISGTIGGAWSAHQDAGGFNLNNLNAVSFTASGSDLSLFGAGDDGFGNRGLSIYDGVAGYGANLYMTTRASGGGAAQNGDVLTYNGSSWYAAPPSGGGGSQTPWAGPIDGAAYSLTNVDEIVGTRTEVLENDGGASHGHDGSNLVIRAASAKAIDGGWDYFGGTLELRGGNGDGGSGNFGGDVQIYAGGGGQPSYIRLYSHDGVERFRVGNGKVVVQGAYELPSGDGTTGQAMVTDGAGTLSFATIGGAGQYVPNIGPWTVTNSNNSATMSFVDGASARLEGTVSGGAVWYMDGTTLQLGNGYNAGNGNIQLQMGAYNEGDFTVTLPSVAILTLDDTVGSKEAVLKGTYDDSGNAVAGFELRPHKLTLRNNFNAGINAATIEVTTNGDIKFNDLANSNLLLKNMVRWVGVPASASASGTPGDAAYESGYLYICVATDTWERVAIATW